MFARPVLRFFSFFERTIRLLPLQTSGGALPEDVWRQRHRFLLGLTWLHAVIIALLGPLLGYSWELSREALFKNGTVLQTFAAGVMVSLCAGFASWRGANRKLRAVLVAFGLMSSSAVFVHLWDGYIELHLHFFVMIIFLTFYQDWIPLLSGILCIAIYYAAMGVLSPQGATGLNAPWIWAAIETFFVLCACVGSIVAWRYNEKAYAQAAGFAQRSQYVLKRIQALHEIGQAITSTLDLQAVLRILMETIDRFLRSSAVLIWLINQQSGSIERAACRNLDEADWKGRKLSGTPALVQAAIEKRAPVVAGNVQTDTLDPHFFRKHGLVSYLGVPLIVRGQVLGVLVLLTRTEHHFSDEEIEFFSALAAQGAIAIHNSQLHEQTKKQAIELEKANEDLKRKEEIQALLKELNQDITRLDIDTLLKKLTGKVREILRVDILDARVLVDGQWKLTGIAGIDSDLMTSGRSGTGRGPAGWIQQHRQPLVVPDITRTDIPMGTTMKSLGVHGYVGVPLFSRDGEVIGVLRGLSYKPREFTQEEVDLLQQLATGSAVALENAKLLEKIKRQAVELEGSNKAKDELLGVMAQQKGELSRLNAGLHREIAERTQARAELAAKNRDLETLLYVTSHDLREPLRAIENFSRIINDRYRERLDEKGQDFLRRVIQGAQRLNRLLDDILTVSRSQRMGAPTEEVEGETIVLEALRRLEGKINTTSAQIKVAKDFHGLRVDKTWATQAVYNLIANALKFTRNGEAPDVEIAPYQPQGPNSEVIGIVVRDRGPGVAPEHRERVFQLFQRAVGREVEGTGAGLAIVRQIAERHGGSAWVEPREGGGSEFIITFSQSSNLEGGNSSGNPANGDPARRG